MNKTEMELNKWIKIYVCHLECNDGFKWLNYLYERRLSKPAENFDEYLELIQVQLNYLDGIVLHDIPEFGIDFEMPIGTGSIIYSNEKRNIYAAE